GVAGAPGVLRAGAVAPVVLPKGARPRLGRLPPGPRPVLRRPRGDGVRHRDPRAVARSRAGAVDARPTDRGAAAEGTRQVASARTCSSRAVAGDRPPAKAWLRRAHRPRARRRRKRRAARLPPGLLLRPRRANVEGPSHGRRMKDDVRAFWESEACGER